MNAIETQNLSHRYWRTEALRDLNLAVPVGSVFALLGANGAGKTTAIKVLMNLLRPSAGVARVLDTDSRRLGEREFAQIGYVSENQQLPLWMTVRQLLDYCRPFYPTWDRALEAKLLAQFELPPERKLKQLSRGMLMKAALLSSLAYRPKLLVLDEPFSGLDPLVREEFTHGLLETSRLGDWTVFISSHDIEEVERLADHIALLENGNLRFTETTESLLSRFRRIEVTFEGAVPAGILPASWLGWRGEAGRASFIESAYNREATERACREHFPEAAVQAHPMSLREIFIALARAKSITAKVSAV
ncbi:ABC transporter ATP-binding protein [Oleiharenicola lentus]|jgi:ABC-2 type transport system ATP-binding protein|uniref:ABC transporter ATP-binding protein n=1 Tax=Oleiharenicola lentus TaxID=2508720 RepID=A0A4Q1CBJ1_9BACT|nr:ABC transporter ATP-binding protein [Oleiharenicola lentus]RXK56475.1 ABC transporter ATP-binding protein [Oleiharenicola lentus]